MRKETFKFSAYNQPNRQHSSSKIPRNWNLSRQDIEEMLEESLELFKWGPEAARA